MLRLVEASTKYVSLGEPPMPVRTKLPSIKEMLPNCGEPKATIRLTCPGVLVLML